MMVNTRIQHSRKRNQAGFRFVIAGTGGQGVLTAARVLGEFFVTCGHSVVASQLHGMAQRSGMIQAAVMIDCGISPALRRGEADFVLGFEPAETARAVPFMSAETIVYMNTAPVVPYTLGQQFVWEKGDGKYPEPRILAKTIRSVTPHLFCFDAKQMARSSGTPKVLNMIMLGLLFGSGSLPYTSEEFWEATVGNVPSGYAEANTKAFFHGVKRGKTIQPSEEIR